MRSAIGILAWPRAMEDGAWLFDHRVAAWLQTPELNRQLPLRFRLFAAHCRLQRRLGSGPRIAGGRLLFHTLARAWRHDRHDFALRAHGFTVYLKLGDPRLLHVPNELSPGDPNRRALERLLAPGDTFIDVGANHGTFSLVAARAIGTGGRVVAVEPQADLARLIGLSLRRSAECAFDVHGEACGDTEGSAKLFVPWFNSGEAGLVASLSGRHRHDEVVVPVRTLDSLVGGTSLPGDVLIKIDVEGNEVAVLLGAKHLIGARGPRLLIELNEPALVASGRRPSDLVELLRGLGFARFAELDRLSALQPLEGLRFEPSRNVLVAR